MTVVTRCPFLLTTNPVTPPLSLILSGAGSLQVSVMEVVVRFATDRPCGGPVGTEVEWRKEWCVGVSVVMVYSILSDRAKNTGVTVNRV